MSWNGNQLAQIPPSQQDIQPLDFVAPGFRGLNTVESGMLIDPSYCTIATNAVIDINGRLAARLGAQRVTTNPISGAPSILSAFEYNGGASIGFNTILAWNGGIGNQCHRLLLLFRSQRYGWSGNRIFKNTLCKTI
jgi:hypothetical protein